MERPALGTALPYLDGERTPDRPGATGVLADLTTSNATPENLARSAAEGVLGSLADAIDLLADCGVGFQHALLIGGGARSAAIREIAPDIFGRDVEVPEPAEYVALGAARQAAWALAGTPEPPDWPRPPARCYAGEPQPELRMRYAALRNATVGWSRNGDGQVPPHPLTVASGAVVVSGRWRHGQGPSRLGLAAVRRLAGMRNKVRT